MQTAYRDRQVPTSVFWECRHSQHEEKVSPELRKSFKCVAPATGVSCNLDPRYRDPYILNIVLDRDQYVLKDFEGAPKKNMKKKRNEYNAQRKCWMMFTSEPRAVNFCKPN